MSLTEHGRDYLVIEDSPADRKLITVGFQETGSRGRLHFVADGDEGLAFLRKEAPFADAPRPHLVILDCVLPRLSGPEVLAEMRRHEDLRHLPVLIFSASDSPRALSEMYEHTVSAVLRKPIEIDEYMAVVKKIFDLFCDRHFVMEREPERRSAA